MTIRTTKQNMQNLVNNRNLLIAEVNNKGGQLTLNATYPEIIAAIASFSLGIPVNTINTLLDTVFGESVLGTYTEKFDILNAYKESIRVAANTKDVDISILEPLSAYSTFISAIILGVSESDVEAILDSINLENITGTYSDKTIAALLAISNIISAITTMNGTLDAQATLASLSDAILSIPVGIAPSTIESILDTINGSVVAGDYVSKSDAIISEKEAIRLAIVAKESTLAVNAPLSDYSDAITAINSGLPQATVEGLLDGIAGEVITGDYTAKIDSIEASKEAIRLAVIGKGVAVGPSVHLGDYAASIAAIPAPGPILFADEAVKAICVAAWGSGGELMQAQAAAVTSAQFGITFKNNTSIISFTELEYFTGLTSIPAEAFRGCSGLISPLRLPKNITSIGDYAFYGCTGLAGPLVIPTGVQSIGSFAFVNCSLLRGNITIPNSVTNFGVDGGIFIGCYALNGALTLSTSLTNIPKNCFYGCYPTGTLTIPASVTYIGEYAFRDCPFTGNLIIPNTVLSLGVTGYQFFNSLFNGTLTIGTGITSIPANCFRTTVFTGAIVIPSNISSIGTGAFNGLTTVTSITVQRTTPPTLGATAFSGTFPIYVPTANVAAYKAASGWSTFAARIFGY